MQVVPAHVKLHSLKLTAESQHLRVTPSLGTSWVFEHSFTTGRCLNSEQLATPPDQHPAFGNSTQVSHLVLFKWNQLPWSAQGGQSISRSGLRVIRSSSAFLRSALFMKSQNHSSDHRTDLSDLLIQQLGLDEVVRTCENTYINFHDKKSFMRNWHVFIYITMLWPVHSAVALDV